MQGDLDPIARYPLSSILHYTIDNVVHRKSGPTIPTLKLSFQVDTPPTTGSFRRKPSQPDLTPRYTTVLFRSVPDDGYTLYDWQQALQSNVFLTSSYHDFDYNYSFLTSGCSSPNFESQPPPPQSQSSFYSTTSLQSLSAVLDSSRSVHSSRSDVSSISSDHRSYFCSTPSVLPSPSFEVPLTPLSEGLNPLLELNPLLKKVSNGSIGMRKAMIIPKESILDRNLMTECIPDSTREAKPEMISLARYNAMMRDLELNQVVGGTPLMPIEYDKDDNMVEMPTPRALEFISSGRSTPGSMKETKPSIFHDSVPPAASHKSLVVDDAGVVPCVIKVNTKTRGLTQFKRRLSSTSSLLLVQT
ncbi:MAG: hypothetical protein M1827_003560 [Pycnora praestabilis]|nr:MAG: hypothetical protein M1827_003560 [Pycnora praestabilis]